MATLPNVEDATIPGEKLWGYVLNPDHPVGMHKARLFRSALGIAQENWEFLRDEILARIPSAEVSSIQPNPFGFLYKVPMVMEGLNGQTHEVITAWFVAEEGDPPRLASAYVNIP
jgi:hypothetical protein